MSRCRHATAKAPKCGSSRPS